MMCVLHFVMLHTKALRADSADAEMSAVRISQKKPWAVPRLHIAGNQVVSKCCVELFGFLQTVDTQADAIALIEGSFRLLCSIHRDNALHLDFHPKNIVVSKEIKTSATTVQVGDTTFALYCIDFETLWHPSCDEDAFNEVSDAWNDCRTGGMGRLSFAAYSVKTCYCYDVYTLCTYIIKFVTNRHVCALRGLLHYICRLDGEKELPYVSAVGKKDEIQKYHTYLMAPTSTVMTAEAAAELLSMLRQVVNALAVNNEHSEIHE